MLKELFLLQNATYFRTFAFVFLKFDFSNSLELDTLLPFLHSESAYIKSYAVTRIKLLMKRFFYTLLYIIGALTAQAQDEFSVPADFVFDVDSSNDSLLFDEMVMDIDQVWKYNMIANIDSMARASERGGASTCICIYDVTADSMMYRYNHQRKQIPASTQKLLVSISALTSLSPEYEFRTNVYSQGHIEEDSLQRKFFKGDFYIAGNFDPTLEYSDIRAIAMRMKEMNADSIDGHIYVDVHQKDALMADRRYSWERVTAEQEYFITPLQFNNARVSLDVPGANPRQRSGRVRHPELYFATALQRTLESYGIRFSMQDATGVGYVPENARRVYSHVTPIKKVLQDMMKSSNNFYAESMLLQLCNEKSNGRWTYDACRKTIEDVMVKRAGCSYSDFIVIDGSGLSHSNKVTAEAEVKLLKYAYDNKRIFNHLYNSLPIAGVDGTLKSRMHSGNAYANVRAKTGTVNGVSTLAGYVTASNGHTLIFSILNNNIGASATGRAFQDKICQEMAK